VLFVKPIAIPQRYLYFRAGKKNSSASADGKTLRFINLIIDFGFWTDDFRRIKYDVPKIMHVADILSNQTKLRNCI
jgi:hypothetical protein